jgi:PIN domain
MMSTTEAANEIKARGGPVVFVDTCSILDLTRGLRDKLKDNLHLDHATAAIHIIKLAERKKLTMVLPQQVLNEFKVRFAEVKNDAITSVKRRNSEKSYLVDLLQIYDAPVSLIPDVSLEMFAKTCEAIADRFKAAAIASNTTVAAKAKAADRTLAGRAPATSGKQSFKDCLILESCYETLSAARDLGFSKSAHFLSSNTSEYFPEVKKPHPLHPLHADLVDEFLALGLEAARNFGELRGKTSIRDL